MRVELVWYLLLLLLIATAVNCANLVRVNCGAPNAVTDTSGRTWDADRSFTGGASGLSTGDTFSNLPNQDTTLNVLFKYERVSDNPNNPIVYTFTNMDTGNYKCRFYMVEGWSGAFTIGARKFNVAIGGTQVLTNFDVFQAAGGPNVVNVQEFDCSPVNGNIVIKVSHGAIQNPKINAIEIVYSSPSPSPSPTPSPTPSPSPSPPLACLPDPTNSIQVKYRINSGGPAYTDTICNKVWTVDNSFIGGTAGSTGTAQTGQPDNTVYMTERWGNHQYQLACDTGASYIVRLWFSEFYAPTKVVGARQANIKVQGTTIETKLDIFAQIGADKALYKDYAFTVTTGTKCIIEFVSVVENTKVDAIELFMTSAAAPAPTPTPSPSPPNPVPGRVNGVAAYYYNFNEMILGVFPKNQVDGNQRKPEYAYVETGSYDKVENYDIFRNSAWTNQFAYRAYFYLTVTQSGQYQFQCPANDGCILTCDGTVLVNNDGNHDEPGPIPNGPTVTWTVGADKSCVLDFYNSEHRSGMHLYWIRPGTTVAELVPGTAMSHDPSVYFPTVHTLTPAMGQSGDTITISGFGFTTNTIVNFGTSVQNTIQYVDRNTIKVTVPANVAASNIQLSVTTSVGTSNSRAFTYNGGGTSTPPPPASSDCVADPDGSTVKYRVNSGGATYTDTCGKTWAADSNFVGGTAGTTTTVQTGYPDKTILMTERWGNHQYEFPCTSGGNYITRLWFSEFYAPTKVVGARKSNIKIQGTTVETNLDIFAQAGADKLLLKQYSFTVDQVTTKCTIQLISVVENTKIDAIELFALPGSTPSTPPPPPPSTPSTPPSPPPPSTPAPPGNTVTGDATYVPLYEPAIHRINCGADADYVDKRGQKWEKDRDYYGATSIDRWTLPFKFIYSMYPEVKQFYAENTYSDEDSILFTNERWASGNWGYKLTVPSGGRFLLRLYFLEFYAGNFELFDWNYRTKGLRGVGTRVFGIQVNGQLVIPKVDVFQSAGPYAAIRREIWVDMATAGTIDIQFTKIVESPMCNAIEVIAEADVVPRQILPSNRKPGLLVHYYDYNPGGSKLLGKAEQVENPIAIMPKFQNDITWVEIADYFNNPAMIGRFRNTPYEVQFAARVRGYLRVPAADTYKITLESNDGSNMRICDTEGLSWAKGECRLIGNDGNHQNTQVTQEFEFTKPGFYRMEVDYFQGQLLTCLRIYWMRKAEFGSFLPYYYVGHAINQDYFSYDPNEVQPVITNVAPNAGSTQGGTTVTLTGVGFSQNAATTYVREYHPCLASPGYKQIKANVISDTTITFTTLPACYGMGSLGVVILNENGSGVVVKQTNTVQYFFN
jgi:hypothetical protein